MQVTLYIKLLIVNGCLLYIKNMLFNEKVNIQFPKNMSMTWCNYQGTHWAMDYMINNNNNHNNNNNELMKQTLKLEK